MPTVLASTTAALVASAAFAAPVAVGPVQFGQRVDQPDPVQGAWLQFGGAGGEQLARIYEDGRVRPVDLPPQLRDERLKITPLPNGWALAVDRWLPPSRSGKECCAGIEEPEPGEPGCCDVWVVAERSPRGRWAVVQELPHSRDNRSWVSEPVEHHGRVEVAWGEQYVEAVRVAEAPLGRPFGPPHVVRHLLPRQFTDSVDVSAKLGGLYEIAEYGPDVSSSEPEFIGERRLYGIGRFGPIHILRSQLLYEHGAFFDVPGGGQLYLYGSGRSEKMLVARRTPFAATLEPPRVVLRSWTGTPDETQSLNGRLLVVSEQQVPPRFQREVIAAVGISTRGVPGAERTIEAQPGGATRYFAGAIGDGGEWLVASTPDEGGALWLHPSSPRCAYREQKIRMPVTVSHEHTTIALSMGKRGIFHLAWVDPRNELQSASVHVVCVRGRYRTTR